MTGGPGTFDRCLVSWLRGIINPGFDGDKHPMGTVPGYWIVHPAVARALAWTSQVPDAKG